MLEQLKISGGACFGDDPLSLSTFAAVNFFFGSNGSGKTTISRALSGQDSLTTHCTWDDSVPMTVKVYNRDFADRILKQSNRIPGVFVLGEKSIEAQERRDAILSKGGERDVVLANRAKARASLEDAKTAAANAKNELRNEVWAKYKAFVEEHPSLGAAFTGAGGIGNSKDQLLARTMGLDAPGDVPPPSLEALLADASAVFDATATPVAEIAPVPVFNASGHEGFALLGSRLVGSEEVTLSELVERLGSSDWTARGMHYLAHSDGVCPLCQQIAPATLATDLASMFDETYVTQVRLVAAFIDAFKRWEAAVISSFDDRDATATAYVDEAADIEARAAIAVAASTNLATLTTKQNSPSEQVEFLELTGLVEASNEIVSKANVKIREHNALISGRRAARPELVDRTWHYLRDVVVDEDIASFTAKEPGRARGLQTLAATVADTEDALAALDTEVRKLERSVESTRPVIDGINAILLRTGFTSFTVVESPDLEDGYMLARVQGRVQEDTLSEGERTFIAFLYYFHLLDGHDGEVAEGSPRQLVVIDDPISSLDSDVLFVVSTLVKRLVRRAMSGTDRIGQLIVLTHNVYFHKEITFEREQDKDRESKQRRTYFVIRKRVAQPSQVHSFRSNPVTTEYRRLWDEVKRAIDGETMSIVGLENVLRRILESYFRVMGGGIWEDDIVPLLSDSDRHIFRALFAWSNEGSHSIVEDIYFSPTLMTQDMYLEVFHRVFKVTNHEAHYQMMLQGRRSLEIVETSNA